MFKLPFFHIVHKRYGKYEGKESLIEIRFGKYGRKVS
jgi:hypothetical protein